jgi:hypothetical protein
MKVLSLQVDVSQLSEEDIEKLQEAMLAPIPTIGGGETEDDDDYTQATLLSVKVHEVDEETGEVIDQEDKDDPSSPIH